MLKEKLHSLIRFPYEEKYRDQLELEMVSLNYRSERTIAFFYAGHAVIYDHSLYLPSRQYLLQLPEAALCHSLRRTGCRTDRTVDYT